MKQECDIEEKIKRFSTHKKVYQGLLLLSIHDDFIVDVKDIRNKYSINWDCTDAQDHYHEFQYAQFNSDKKESDTKTPFENSVNKKEYKKYKKSLEKLMLKYNLSIEYEEMLDVYIQQDFISSIFAQQHSYDVDIHKFIEDDANYLSMRVYPTITKKEFMESWETIKNTLDIAGPDMLKKDIKQLERDIEIYKLKKEGKTSNEIAQIINKDSKWGKTCLTYKDVDHINYKLKKRISEISHM